MKTKQQKPAKMDESSKIISEIAARFLDIETIETRNSDRLDFYDLSVSSIKAALEAAFEAGRKH